MCCMQGVQKDIESRSRIVSAVLKLCSWLKVAASTGEEGEMGIGDRKSLESERAAVQTEAELVEQRWHSVWIQSVEWQLRLEDAVSGRSVRTVFSYEHRHVLQCGRHKSKYRV